MNTCDHGHPAMEIRVLPYSELGNLLVCKKHYWQEIAFRKERISEGVPYDLPTWDSLRVYSTEDES